MHTPIVSRSCALLRHAVGAVVPRANLLRVAAVVVPVLVAGAIDASAQDADGTAPEGGREVRVESVVFKERTLLIEAMASALRGNDHAALVLLATSVEARGRGNEVTAGRLGWRVLAVAGSLRNQSRYAEAERFTRYALSQPWCDARQIASAKERAKVLYWCSRLSAEMLGDRRQALLWLAEAAQADPELAEVGKLRAELEVAHRAFPRG